MSVSTFGRFKVKDFDRFMQVFESGYEIRKQLGVVDSRILRDPDDPNLLLAWYEFADVNTAQAYVDMINSDQFGESPPVKEGGVILETVEVWMGESV